MAFCTLLALRLVYTQLGRCMHLRRVLLAGAAVRLALALAGTWQDAHSRIRYTDVDYDVFSDAARFMAAGRSPVCSA